MAGSKRERQLARAKFERQQARRVEQRQRRRRRTQVTASVVVAALAVGGFAWLANVLQNRDTTDQAASDPNRRVCLYSPSGESAKPLAEAQPPLTTSIEPAVKTATLTLAQGAVTVQLLNAKAPCTVNSFAFLAGQDYFNGTTCHRLTKGTLNVLQCGDPTGKGNGGPGYSFADENLTGATYPAGTVAMANGGPNTNGSQFFLVYADSQLPPSYTPFGKVTAGLNVLTGIAKAGIAGGKTDGAPAKPVTVTSVTVTEG